MARTVVFLACLACALAANPRSLAFLASGPSVPVGVNFGGWLCLEDWFYSGVEGVSVSTSSDTPSGQGACLPPMVSQLENHWGSEGGLTKTLNDTLGPKQTADALMAHRRSFIGDRDLEAVRDLGIQTIRVPLSWAAFADALAPIDKHTYGAHDPDEEAVVVPDPFYATTKAFVTIPRSWLKMFLRRVHDHGLRVIFDLHSFPGASSEGTYNGVWPDPPKFWTANSTLGNHSVALTEAGHLITGAMIKWVEGLPELERQTVKGVTLMNEPGHLSAWASWTSEDQILGWLAEASEQFRSSSLPSLGIQLYVNIIETAFQDFDKTVPPWWNKTFSAHEQQRWAVIDIHWYAAWSGSIASGRTTPGGAYYCDQPLAEIRKIVEVAAADHVKTVMKDFGAGTLKAISEFSVGSFDQALQACTDPAVLEMYLDVQVKAFQAASIEPFFWTWHMPYGTSFEPGWSLKHLLGKEHAHQALPCEKPTNPSRMQALKKVMAPVVSNRETLEI